MKKVNFTLWLLCLFLSLSFFSCKKKDTESPSTKSLIIGKWTLSSTGYKYYVSGKLDDSGTEPGNAGETYEFKADGSVVYVSKKDAAPQTAGTWSLTPDDKKIILTYTNSYSNTLEIKELASSKMTVFLLDEYTSNNVAYRDEYTLFFIK